NRRADMARHDDRAFDVRSVEPELAYQRFGKALHGEFRRTISRMRHVGPEACPKAVDAARVDDVPFIGLLQHRHKGACAKIDAAPADVEGFFPLVTRVGEEAAATADAGVVEEEIDLVGALPIG